MCRRSGGPHILPGGEACARMATSRRANGWKYVGKPSERSGSGRIVFLQFSRSHARFRLGVFQRAFLLCARFFVPKERESFFSGGKRLFVCFSHGSRYFCSFTLLQTHILCLSRGSGSGLMLGHGTETGPAWDGTYWAWSRLEGRWRMLTVGGVDQEDGSLIWWIEKQQSEF